MLIRIALVLELVSLIICIFRINGKKIKLDMDVMILFIVLLMFLDYFNRMQVSRIYKIVIYIIIYIFCRYKFGTKYIATGINIFILMIVLTASQFICLVLAAILIPEQEMPRTVLGNIFVLFMCMWVFPRCRLDKVQNAVFRKQKFVKVLFVFMLFVVGTLLLHNSNSRGIYAEIFIFAVPAVLFLIEMIGKWSGVLIEVESIENELEINKTMQEKYDELLINVRMRQHEFKNHITAIFSTHYTYNTYEKLVKAQAEYCEKLQVENKYNNLLCLRSKVLAGFLYGKFQDAEEDGVVIEHSIKSSLESLNIPEYRLIEMLGILLDNAVESIDTNDSRNKISFLITEEREKYNFVIRNEHSYVPYDEMEKWFLLEHSEKGRERGIGLYHIKVLCEELKCNVGCRNVSINEENWIEFKLEIEKVGR